MSALNFSRRTFVTHLSLQKFDENPKNVEIGNKAGVIPLAQRDNRFLVKYRPVSDVVTHSNKTIGP